MRPLIACAVTLLSTCLSAEAEIPGPSPRYPCWVRVHVGAQPYLDDAAGVMRPVPTVGPTKEVDLTGGPLLYIETEAEGSPWVWRLGGYAYHRKDVELFGDCTHVRVE